MVAPVRTNQVNQMTRHPRKTFGAVVVDVNKRSVSADALAFIPNYLLGVDLFNSKSQRNSNDDLLVNSLKV